MSSRMNAMGLVGALGLVTSAVTVLFLPPDEIAPKSSLFAQAPPAEQLTSHDIAGAEQLSRSFKSAAKILKPAVVKITAKVEPRVFERRNSDFGFPDEFRGLLPELFQEFDRRQLPQQRNPSRSRETEKVPTGVGSGVIVTPNGYILTNNHVVRDADELEIHVSDGRKFAAKVVGTDPKTDIAVIKVEASGLTSARLGDSDRMEVGDWVIAIGSPFGLEHSVTAGIISATNREEVGILNGGYEDFLQTDAAINPGNSGGPLVNLRGEVIGINTAIKSNVGTNAGIGFAIPSNLAQQVMQSLLKDGRVVRGFIGATLSPLDERSRQQLEVPANVTSGAVIARVYKNTPASKSGLLNGDVVTAIDGRSVSSVPELRRMIALTQPGKSTTIQVLRNGRPQSVKVTVEEFSEEKLASLRVIVEELGIEITDLTPDIAEQLGLESDQQGAVVVASESRVLRQGDVIVEINGQEIESADDVPATIAKNRRNFKMGVLRNGTLIPFGGTLN